MNIKVEFINHEYRPKYNKKMKIIGKLGNDVYLVKVDKGNSRVLDLHTKAKRQQIKNYSMSNVEI